MHLILFVFEIKIFFEAEQVCLYNLQNKTILQEYTLNFVDINLILFHRRNC